MPCPATTSGWSNGGMKTAPVALGELGRGPQRLVDGVAAQHDLGAVVAGRLQLGQRDADGHEDRGA